MSDIWRIYFPLACSWLFMSIEGPVSVAIISRMVDPVIGTAAFNVLMALAIFIESPVIDLLSTSTTLGKTGRDYATLSRFTWLMMLWVTVVHALVAIPPVFHWVTQGLLGLKPDVAQAAWLPFAIMIPWSACVGWRRYLQGLMIRHGRTRPIGVGTFVRVSAICLVGFGLMQSVDWPGILVAGVALMTSVFSEAVFMHIVSRPLIREVYAVDTGGASSVTLREMFRFHLPLTGSTMVTLAALPMISATLALAPDAVVAMAAWQVAFSVQWMFRTVTFAIPEVVISRMDGPVEQPVLRRFALIVGTTLSAAAILFCLSPLDDWVFSNVLRAKPELVPLASQALLLSALLPFINAAMSYLRGVLTARRQTSVRLVSIIIATVVLVACLVLGWQMQWPGVVTAAVSLTVAQLAELATLAIAARASNRHFLAESGT